MALKAPSRAAARRFVGVALLALLLAQWAALWHAVAHGPLHTATAAHSAHAETEAPGFGDAAHHTGHHHVGHHHAGPLSAAVHGHADHSGHAAGSPVCQLFDHLLQGQAPDTVGPLADSDTRACEAPQVRPASATPSTALPAYEARGPPRA